MIEKHKTKVLTMPDSVLVKYHDTTIVAFNEEKIILDTGGYDTATTRRRMNQVSQEFGLGFKIYQRNFRWYVGINGQELPYREQTITLYRKAVTNV